MLVDRQPKPQSAETAQDNVQGLHAFNVEPGGPPVWGKGQLCAVLAAWRDSGSDLQGHKQWGSPVMLADSIWHSNSAGQAEADWSQSSGHAGLALQGGSREPQLPGCASWGPVKSLHCGCRKSYSR